MRRRLVLVAALPAVWQLVTLARIFAARLTYPADIEWMEGGQLYHAHRLLQGEPVYGAPDQGFVPYGYGPLHAWVLAGVGGVTELDYWSGRLVSIVAIAVVGLVLHHQVRRHVGPGPVGHTLALLAVGSLAAGFPVTGGWYDLVRTDSLAVCLPVAAAALAAAPERLADRRRWVGLALLLAAALLAKQSNVFLVAWIALFVVVVDRRAGRRAGRRVVLLAAGVTVAVVGVLQVASGGWFLTWFTLMGRHGLELDRLPAAVRAIGSFAPYLALVPALVLVAQQRGWLTRRVVLWLGMLVAGVPTALLPFLKVGGHPNNFLPIVVLAGPVMLLVLVDVGRGLASAEGKAAPMSARGLRAVRVAVVVGAAAFLAGQAYDIDPFVPTAERRDAAERLNTLVGGLDGGVLVPGSPFLAVRNGQAGDQVHAMAHFDAALAGVPGTELHRFLADSEARWLLVAPEQWMAVHQAGGFERSERVVPEVETLTGMVTAPSELYRRPEPRPRGPGAGPPHSGRGSSPDGADDGDGTALGPPRHRLRPASADRLAEAG